MNHDKKISVEWAVTVAIGALITGSISTAFALVRISNSDHFSIIAISDRITTLETVVVPRSELSQSLSNIHQRLDSIEKGVSTTNSLVYKLLER